MTRSRKALSLISHIAVSLLETWAFALLWFGLLGLIVRVLL